VNVADKRCDNGHFIDESWDICPYCPNEGAEPDIPVVRPRAAEPAAAAPARPAASPLSAADATGTGGMRVQRNTSSAAAPVLQVAATGPGPERTVAASKIDMGPQQKRYVVGWLIGLNGSARGESYPVRMGRNVIGRDRRSDIVINDDQASSHHTDLVFRPEERRFILMDHNSTNGTYVNEAEIEPRRDLNGEDVVRIGSHRLLFVPLCHEGFFWDDEGLLK
jgi:hypothetical protein